METVTISLKRYEQLTQIELSFNSKLEEAKKEAELSLESYRNDIKNLLVTEKRILNEKLCELEKERNQFNKSKVKKDLVNIIKLHAVEKSKRIELQKKLAELKKML